MAPAAAPQPQAPQRTSKRGQAPVDVRDSARKSPHAPNVAETGTSMEYVPENQGEELWAGEEGGGMYDSDDQDGDVVVDAMDDAADDIDNNDDNDLASPLVAAADAAQQPLQALDDTDNEDNDDNNNEGADAMDVYLPGQALDDGEELVADLSTYELLQTMGAEWPCLSFDILRDSLGFGRTLFPATLYMVAGSQADGSDKNKLYVMKMSQLHRTKAEDDDDGIDLENPNDDEDPVLEYRTLAHNGTVNRLRVMPHVAGGSESHHEIVASWSDLGKVYLFDVAQHVRSIDTPGVVASHTQAPFHTVTRHRTEGYALDWSRTQQGHLLSGDCDGKIFYTMPQGTGFGSFTTNSTPFTGHTDSVEDLQWSPRQQTVFASGSVDRTIKVWDTRKKGGAAISVHAHDSDVNIISWNHLADHLIASGSDDGDFAVWDLRSWKPSQKAEPAARFKWHTGPITAIEWKPKDASTLAVAGADNQMTLWDIALERDQEEEPSSLNGVEVPPQLLFVHQGQTDLKEVHWHPQIDGLLVTSAVDGFNIIKTINS